MKLTKSKLYQAFEKSVEVYKKRTHSLVVPHMHEAKSLIKLLYKTYENSNDIKIRLFKYIIQIEDERAYVCYRYAWKWRVTKKDPVRVVFSNKQPKAPVTQK